MKRTEIENEICEAGRPGDVPCGPRFGGSGRRRQGSRHRFGQRPVGTLCRLRRPRRQSRADAFHGGQRSRWGSRKKNPLRRRGQQLPDAEGAAGLQQARQSRQGLRDAALARHADEHRRLQAHDPEKHSQRVPAVVGAADPERTDPAALRRRQLLLRRTAAGGPLHGEEQRRSQALRHVHPDRFRQGDPGCASPAPASITTNCGRRPVTWRRTTA